MCDILNRKLNNKEGVPLILKVLDYLHQIEFQDKDSPLFHALNRSPLFLTLL
jgi:hypothetical protein